MSAQKMAVRKPWLRTTATSRQAIRTWETVFHATTYPILEFGLKPDLKHLAKGVQPRRYEQGERRR